MKITDEPIKLKITKADAAKASDYFDNHECLLCQAAKRIFPRARNIWAGGTSLSVGKRCFNLSGRDSWKINRAYVPEPGGGDREIRPNFRGITVTLTPGKPD